MSIILRASDGRLLRRLENLAARVSHLPEPSPSNVRVRIDAYSDIMNLRNDLASIMIRMERDHRDVAYVRHVWELLDLAVLVLAHSAPEGVGYVSRDLAAQMLSDAGRILIDEHLPSRT